MTLYLPFLVSLQLTLQIQRAPCVALKILAHGEIRTKRMSRQKPSWYGKATCISYTFEYEPSPTTRQDLHTRSLPHYTWSCRLRKRFLSHTHRPSPSVPYPAINSATASLLLAEAGSHLQTRFSPPLGPTDLHGRNTCTHPHRHRNVRGTHTRLLPAAYPVVTSFPSSPPLPKHLPTPSYHPTPPIPPSCSFHRKKPSCSRKHIALSRSGCPLPLASSPTKPSTAYIHLSLSTPHPTFAQIPQPASLVPPPIAPSLAS